ncbi:hypothetical protein WA026_010171 [Henosepilachna vigintioctopunctata]|uniref:Uncharacterized protein n=1 Tax=Henosepilachna vigintioctopunctata TaxID=420089 RepID=A0AAW1UHH6_9CUCU
MQYEVHEIQLIECLPCRAIFVTKETAHIGSPGTQITEPTTLIVTLTTYAILSFNLVEPYGHLPGLKHQDKGNTSDTKLFKVALQRLTS